MSAAIVDGVLKLRKPLQVKGGTVEELRLPHPTGGQVLMAERKLDAGTNPEAVRSFAITLVSGVSGKAPELVEMVPVSEVMDACAYLQQRYIVLPAEAALDQDPELTLDLEDAVEHSGVSYAQLVLTEPTTGMVRKAEGHLRGGQSPGNLRTHQIALIANATELPFAAVAKMPVQTLMRAAHFLQGFT